MILFAQLVLVDWDAERIGSEMKLKFKVSWTELYSFQNTLGRFLTIAQNEQVRFA